MNYNHALFSSQVVGEGDIKTAPLAFSVVALAPPVFTRKVETTAIEDGAGGEEGEEVLPDKSTSRWWCRRRLRCVDTWSPMFPLRKNVVV